MWRYPARVSLIGSLVLPLGARADEVQVSVSQEMDASKSTASEVKLNVSTTEASNEFTDEGLSEEDLLLDLEAEALPGEGFKFWRENAWLRIRTAFTFQAERKAELLRFHLHLLDRKLAACAEIGNEDCVKRLEQHIQQVKDRAERHLERKQEILAAQKERFEKWRAAREERIAKMRERAEKRREHLKELSEKRREHMQEARKRRQEYIEQVRQRRTERKDQRQEQMPERKLERQGQRQENRQELIKQYDQRVKNRLDAAQEKVETRRQRVQAEENK